MKDANGEAVPEISEDIIKCSRVKIDVFLLKSSCQNYQVLLSLTFLVFSEGAENNKCKDHCRCTK